MLLGMFPNTQINLIFNSVADTYACELFFGKITLIFNINYYG